MHARMEEDRARLDVSETCLDEVGDRQKRGKEGREGNF